MRRLLSVAVLLGALWSVPSASALTPKQVTKVLAREIGSAGPASGVYVEDLATGERVFARRAGAARIPASVEKLYTTTGAQATFSDEGTLLTAALATERVGLDGVLDGDLYLRGGGDPGLTPDDLEKLAQVLADDGLRRITGRVIGDDTAFDARRGPPSEGFRPSQYVAPLGALMINRGLSGRTSPYYQPSPARFAATAFARALDDAGVRVRRTGRAGRTPRGALALNGVESDTVAEIIKQQNVPSDNWIAEIMLKAIGMTESRAGTTARGAAVAVESIEDLFGVTPRIVDGSGLSRGNATSPRQVVEVLAGKFEDEAFFDSLAVAGVSGTLRNRLRSGATRGRCRGKTGTLSNVSNLAGYCRTRGGTTLAFAILNNRISPSTAHGIQDRMVNAMARYVP